LRLASSASPLLSRRSPDDWVQVLPSRSVLTALR
jgi:hypothetical protein